MSDLPVDTARDLSIIIVNHRADAILPGCLAAIRDSDRLPSCEVIIIDNPAEADSGASILPVGLTIRRMALPGRVGFGAACNAGAAVASGRQLLFLNPDVCVNRSAIAELAETLARYRGAGIVTGRLANANGSFQPTCRPFPTLPNLLFSRGSVLTRIRGKRSPAYSLPDLADTTVVDASAAALLMMPKELFDRLGGFDPGFFLYLEDTDLCLRAHQAGYLTLFVPAAGGVHQWGYSTRHYRFRRIIWHHRSVWRYFRKHHRSAAAGALLAPMLAANCLLSLSLELCTLRR